MKRMLMAGLSRAFEKWQQVAAEMKAEEDALRGALIRFTTRIVGACFNQWRETAAQLEVQMRHLRKAVIAMAKRGLRMAFTAWRGNADRTSHQRKLINKCGRRAANNQSFVEQIKAGEYYKTKTRGMVHSDRDCEHIRHLTDETRVVLPVCSDCKSRMNERVVALLDQSRS